MQQNGIPGSSCSNTRKLKIVERNRFQLSRRGDAPSGNDQRKHILTSATWRAYHISGCQGCLGDRSTDRHAGSPRALRPQSAESRTDCEYSHLVSLNSVVRVISLAVGIHKSMQIVSSLLGLKIYLRKKQNGLIEWHPN
jgi:hypothetical protein